LSIKLYFVVYRIDIKDASLLVITVLYKVDIFLISTF